MSTDTTTADEQAQHTNASAGATPDTQRRERTLPRVPGWASKAGEPLVMVGQIVQLGLRVFGMVLRRPWGFWSDTRDQCWEALKLCWFPMTMASFGFGFGAPGLTGGAIFHIFGIPYRLGSFFEFASIREFAPFIDGMVMAGVVGTAVTADLGARRIREELDALEVLGVDPVRSLVIPRVLAITFMTAIMDIMTLLVGLASGVVSSVFIYGANVPAYTSSLFDLLNTPDIWGSIVKAALFGLVMAVVCCYMGLNVQGGSIGVGRAVNQAVVISFAGVWVVNFVFTLTLLALSPSLYVFK